MHKCPIIGSCIYSIHIYKSCLEHHNPCYSGGRMTLSQSAESYSRLSTGSVAVSIPPPLQMYGYYAGTPHKISIPYRILCSHWHRGSGRFLLGRPVDPEQRLAERGPSQFQENGKQASELTKAAINDDHPYTSTQTRTLSSTTILAILGVE